MVKTLVSARSIYIFLVMTDITKCPCDHKVVIFLIRGPSKNYVTPTPRSNFSLTRDIILHICKILTNIHKYSQTEEITTKKRDIDEWKKKMTRKEYCCKFFANKECFDVKSTLQRNKILELEFPFYFTSTPLSLTKTLILYLKF